MLLSAGPTAAADEPRWTWAASVREQLEHLSEDRLDAADSSDTVLLHRLRLGLDTQWHPVLRSYVQLAASTQSGRDGGSARLDKSAPDLAQGYLELTLPNTAVQLRAGRQEWSLGSGRLLSVRDGPNIRRAFDGARATAAIGNVRSLVFWGRPLRNDAGAFDDDANSGESLGGLNLSLAGAGLRPSFDLYWLRYDRDVARFASGLAREQRQSFGLRAYGEWQSFDADSELVIQRGAWGSTQIRAWTIANSVGYRLVVAGKPLRFGLKADLASGDRDPDDHRLGSFNALYPNPSYFSEAAYIAPTNLIDLQPNLQLDLSPSLRLTAGWNLLWKQQRADAVYTTPVPLTPIADSVGSGRRIGQQMQLLAGWDAAKHLRVDASYVHSQASRALRERAQAHLDFFQLVLSLDYGSP